MSILSNRLQKKIEIKEGGKIRKMDTHTHTHTHMTKNGASIVNKRFQT